MIHAATETPDPESPILDWKTLRNYRRSLLREIDAVVSAYRRRGDQPERWLSQVTDLPWSNLSDSARLHKKWGETYARKIASAQRFYDQRVETVDGREALARLKAQFAAKGFDLEWEESFETDPALWMPLDLGLLNNHPVANVLLANRRWSWGAELQVDDQRKRARLIAPPADPTPYVAYSDFVNHYLRPQVEGRGFVSILFQRDGIYGLSSTGWPHLIDKLFMPEGLGRFFADRGGNFALGLMLPSRDHDRWWDDTKNLLDPRNLRRISADGSWGSPEHPVQPQFGGKTSENLTGYVAKTIVELDTDPTTGRTTTRTVPASYIIASAAGLEEPPSALSQAEAEVQAYFQKQEGQVPDGPRVLFLFPPGQKVVDRYRARSSEVVVLKDEHEPSGLIDPLDPSALSRIIREIDREGSVEYLAAFVNDRVDAELLAALPSLKGITHMGLGTNNFTKEALEIIARRGIRLSYVGRADGQDPVLTNATAETLEALFLTRWFKALERVKFVSPGEQVPAGRSWKQIFRTNLSKTFERDQYVLSIADLYWAMLLRQAGKIDEAVKIVRRGDFKGALNGAKGTVRGHQISSVSGIGLKTTLGFSGTGDFLIRWIALAHAHGVDRILYTGPREVTFEEQFGAEHVSSLDELAQGTDYVMVSPDDTAVLSRGVHERLDGQRTYRWLVDSADWKVPEGLADSGEEIHAVLNSTLAGRRLGFLGLGHIGAKTARFMAPFHAFMHSVKHREDNPIYDQLGQPPGTGIGVGMQYPLPTPIKDLSEEVRGLLNTSDGVLAALPGGPNVQAFLAVDNWPARDEKPRRRRVFANVGRGGVFGDEQKVADELRSRSDVELALDVLTNEALPLQQQPLLALGLPVDATPHIASNKESPSGVSVREDGMGMVMADNFDAMLDGKKQEDLPNPVKLPTASGLEEPNLKGVAFLAFDPALGPPLVRLLEPLGAEVFVVAETPAVARELISREISPQHIVGVLRLNTDLKDYWEVDPEIQRFASGDSPKWKDEFAKRMQMGMGRRVIPIYDVEQMSAQLSVLGIPGPMIQQILDQQVEMEEGLSVGT